MICKRCLVSGRVQGVYYRASTAQRATTLGLRGHARNLPDGRVEVLVIGEESAVEQLVAWLWEGPSAAQVLAIDITQIEPSDAPSAPGFATG